MVTIKNAGCIIFVMVFIGCSSLPKNVTQKEYDAVRDYVSVKISGMTYWVLLDNLERQEAPKFYYDGARASSAGNQFFLDYPKEKTGSQFLEYHKYVMKISRKMQQLADRYKRVGQPEDFYTWTTQNYEE